MSAYKYTPRQRFIDLFFSRLLNPHKSNFLGFLEFRMKPVFEIAGVNLDPVRQNVKMGNFDNLLNQ